MEIQTSLMCVNPSEGIYDFQVNKEHFYLFTKPLKKSFLSFSLPKYNVVVLNNLIATGKEGFKCDCKSFIAIASKIHSLVSNNSVSANHRIIVIGCEIASKEESDMFSKSDSIFRSDVNEFGDYVKKTITENIGNNGNLEKITGVICEIATYHKCLKKVGEGVVKFDPPEFVDQEEAFKSLQIPIIEE